MNYKVRNIPTGQYTSLTKEAERTNTSINQQILAAIAHHTLTLREDKPFSQIPPCGWFILDGVTFIKSVSGDVAFSVEMGVSTVIDHDAMVTPIPTR